MALMSLSADAPARLPDGAYDVRGWQVRTEADGHKVGKVDDMLLDEEDRPRYVDVKLTGRKHVLVPLSEAHADPSSQVVWIDRLDRERLRQVPTYDHDPARLSPAYERRLLAEYRQLGLDQPVKPERVSDGNGAPSHLSRLGKLENYRVAKGVTDPRGWKIVSGDGQVLGKVSELIVDTRALTTRYLDCRVKEGDLELEPVDRHVLVPVERARLDRKEKHVVVDGLFAQDLTEYPIYRGLPLAAGDEARIRAMYERREDDGSIPEVRRFFRAEPTELELGTPSSAWRDVDDQETLEADGREEVQIRVRDGDVVIRQPKGQRDDG